MIFVHVYAHTYIHACIHTYTNTSVYMYINTYVFLYVHTHIYMHIYTQTQTQTQTHKNTHTHIYTYQQVCDFCTLPLTNPLAYFAILSAFFQCGIKDFSNDHLKPLILIDKYTL